LLRRVYEAARIVLAASFALTLIWLAEEQQAAKDHDQAVATTVSRNENLAIALEQFTARTVQSADVVARLLKAGAERGDAQSSLERIMASGMLDKALFQGAGVLDEFGNVVASSSQYRNEINYADRAYFREHAQKDSALVLVAAPVVSRRLGEPSIPITRRINKPDGAFGGVAVVQLSPQRFSELYKNVALVGEDFISVVGLDGITRFRRSGRAETSGDDYSRSKLFRSGVKPVGSVKGPGIDGVERYVSYRTLADYGLMVVVGVTEENALTAYRHHRRINLSIAAGVSALVVLFSAVSFLFMHWRARDASKLRASDDRLQLAMEAGNMAPWEYSLEESSNGFVDRLQSSDPRFLSIAWVHPDDRHLLGEFARRLGPQTETVEFRGGRHSNNERWFGLRARRVEDRLLAGVLFDVTERKAGELELERLANHDTLTGLPNRALFYRRFRAALEKALQDGTSVYLMLIDLDDFKDVNDTLGHDAGDALLEQIARRIEQSPEISIVARLGGDEFSVLLTSECDVDGAIALAEALREVICQPCGFGGRLVSTRASIGIAVFPEHDSDSANLMKDADIALYRAKSEGRNRTVVFRKEMRSLMEERLDLLKEIRAGLQSGEFVPFYQPKVCLRTLEVVGFEALARWRHPTKGLLTPGAFGAVFDDAELADLLGRAMVKAVARDAAEWMKAGVRFGRIAVNLSSAEFSRQDLAEDVMTTWTNAGVPLGNLEVEVTETVFLGADLDLAARTLARFREGGVHVALDDFGTGFASLTHLKKFEVDHIKIDQSFIRSLLDSVGDRAIVSAVVALSASFELEVTAEGVETNEQAALLARLGCDFAQGYHYAKPMAGTRVPTFLTKWAESDACTLPQQVVA
jgi:diguanylate cyclase (GGDEF)-like protein